MSNSIRPFSGQFPILGDNVYVDPAATVIGTVTLGKNVSVWPTAVIRGDVNSITVGEGTNIQDGAILHGTHDGPYCPGGRALFIGQGVTVGHKAVLHACTIGDYCLIGMGVLVLDDAIIENHVVIGAGSVVPPGKCLQSGYLYLGSPARKIRELTSSEISHLRYSANYYIDLKNQYLSAF